MNELKTLEEHIKERLQELYVKRRSDATMPHGDISVIFLNGQIEALEWVLKDLGVM